jgi:hypothetical protein
LRRCPFENFLGRDDITGFAVLRTYWKMRKNDLKAARGRLQGRLFAAGKAAFEPKNPRSTPCIEV